MTRTRPASETIRLVVVGSIGLDTIATPNAQRRDVLGGSVTHAGAASAFFAKTGMIGVVGADFPRRHWERYSQLGLDTAGLQQIDGKTFRWSGVYENDMNNRRTLRTDLNALARFDPVVPPAYQPAPFLFLANMQPTLQLRVLDQMRRPRFVAADTMDLWIRTARRDLERVLKRVDLLTLNDAEVRELTGRQNLIQAARRALAMGPRYVALKKGEHGAMLFTATNLTLVPAFPVDRVVDPTGAGDTFAGGFMGALARAGRANAATIREALVVASVMASFCVESFGPDAVAGLDRLQFQRRMKAFRRMMAG